MLLINKLKNINTLLITLFSSFLFRLNYEICKCSLKIRLILPNKFAPNKFAFDAEIIQYTISILTFFYYFSKSLRNPSFIYVFFLAVSECVSLRICQRSAMKCTKHETQMTSPYESNYNYNYNYNKTLHCTPVVIKFSS